MLAWKLQCGTASHTINSFINKFLHAGIYCKESLIWFENSGLCYTIRPWILTGIHRTGQTPPPHCLWIQQMTNVDAGLGQKINLIWSKVVAGLISRPSLSSLHHQGELSSLALVSSALAVINKGWGQFSSFHVLRV